MSNTFNESEHPRAAGGQWTTKAKSEPDVTLDASLTDGSYDPVVGDLTAEPTFAVRVRGRVVARGLSQQDAWRRADAEQANRPDVSVTVRPE